MFTNKALFNVYHFLTTGKYTVMRPARCRKMTKVYRSPTDAAAAMGAENANASGTDTGASVGGSGLGFAHVHAPVDVNTAPPSVLSMV